MNCTLPNHVRCHGRVQENEGDCRKAIEGRNPVGTGGNAPYRTWAVSNLVPGLLPRQFTDCPGEIDKRQSRTRGLFWSAEGEEGAWGRLERADEAERRLQQLA